MSGGAQEQQQPGGENADQAAQNATTSGAAGSVANMPTWQKGLYGALSGSSAYGPNAPAIHQLLTAGTRMLQPQQPMQQPQMPQRRPMPQGLLPSAAPGPAASMTPSLAPPMTGQPGGGQISPQMLQQLMQTNPQLAQQLLQQNPGFAQMMQGPGQPQGLWGGPTRGV